MHVAHISKLFTIFNKKIVKITLSGEVRMDYIQL